MGPREVEYRAWCNMKSRCYWPGHNSYQHYGGRGVIVCERWLHNFDNFYYDVGPKPHKTFSLDRIDVNGHYEPGNVRWASPLDQAHNQNLKRNNKLGCMGITYEPERQKYRVRISVGRRRITIGRFRLLNDAKRARIKAEKELWGIEPSAQPKGLTKAK